LPEGTAKFVGGRTPSRKSAGVRWLEKFFERRCGSTLEETTVGGELFALWRATTAARAILDEDFANEGLWYEFDPASRAASAMAFEIAPVPPRLKPQERKRRPISPHVMMEKNVGGGAGRTDCREKNVPMMPGGPTWFALRTSFKTTVEEVGGAIGS